MGFACFSGLTGGGGNFPPVKYPAVLGAGFREDGSGWVLPPPPLPEGCLLVVDDRIGYGGQEAEPLIRGLKTYVNENHCRGVVLDFERTASAESRAFVKALDAGLDVPLAASPPYAQGEMGVFLPPLPVTECLGKYLAPWEGREIILDFYPQDVQYLVDKNGCRVTSEEALPCPFVDKNLHVRYGMEVREEEVRFQLKRDPEQLRALAEEAENLGVSCGLGLYSEIGDGFFP